MVRKHLRRFSAAMLLPTDANCCRNDSWAYRDSWRFIRFHVLMIGEAATKRKKKGRKTKNFWPASGDPLTSHYGGWSSSINWQGLAGLAGRWSRGAPTCQWPCHPDRFILHRLLPRLSWQGPVRVWRAADTATTAPAAAAALSSSPSFYSSSSASCYYYYFVLPFLLSFPHTTCTPNWFE